MVTVGAFGRPWFVWLMHAATMHRTLRIIDVAFVESPHKTLTVALVRIFFILFIIAATPLILSRHHTNHQPSREFRNTYEWCTGIRQPRKLLAQLPQCPPAVEITFLDLSFPSFWQGAQRRGTYNQIQPLFLVWFIRPNLTSKVERDTRTNWGLSAYVPVCK